MPDRIAVVQRETKETSIRLTLNIDGSGACSVDSGIPFLDHMLNGFARHGLFDLNAKIRGDVEVDSHHTIEDTGIVLGEAIKKAVGEGGDPQIWSRDPSDGRRACALRGGSVGQTVSGIGPYFYRGKNRRHGHGDGAGIFLCGFLFRRDESAL